jgi:hypothetical protein
MVQRFQKLNVPLHFVEPVHTNDPRLIDFQDENPHRLRNWSIMLQHLDSIQHFIHHSHDDFCVVCEDDILISKDFLTHIPLCITSFLSLQLDVLLLGYLLPFTIHTGNHHFPLLLNSSPFSFHDFPSDLWGSQMYLISRKHASSIISQFISNLPLPLHSSIPFSPDWTLTKFGKKALIYPMLALENGTTNSDLQSEIFFHHSCFLHNYNFSFF